MKNFSKLLMVLSLIVITSQTFAQVNFGLRIGTNFSKQLYQYDGEDAFDDMKMLPGGNLGFVLDIEVNEPLSIETGMLLNTKGYRRKWTEADTDYKLYNYLAYLDVPINAKYTFDLGGPRFYLNAGPYLAFAVFGKAAAVSSDPAEGTSEIDIEFGNEEIDDYKRFDFGFNIGGGFEFGSFVIGANYGLGLKNIGTIDDLKIKNRVLSVSIGVNFGN